MFLQLDKTKIARLIKRLKTKCEKIEKENGLSVTKADIAQGIVIREEIDRRYSPFIAMFADMYKPDPSVEKVMVFLANGFYREHGLMIVSYGDWYYKDSKVTYNDLDLTDGLYTAMSTTFTFPPSHKYHRDNMLKRMPDNNIRDRVLNEILVTREASQIYQAHIDLVFSQRPQKSTYQFEKLITRLEKIVAFSDKNPTVLISEGEMNEINELI